MKTSLIIVAGGFSVRMGGGVRKPYLHIDGKPIFFYTLDTYSKVSSIGQVVFVVNALDIQMVKEKWGEHMKREYNVTDIVTGGERRQDSVYNGLKQVKSNSDVVLIHDCVRPFISQKIIKQIIQKSYDCGAAIAAVPVKDTIKESGYINKSVVRRTVPRENLWAAQTPQGFKRDIIVNAYDVLQDNDFDATDDAQVVERFGYSVELVHGSYNNIKITTQEDLKMAEAFLKQ